ncbi:MAG: hypothetical protein HOF02_02305 [Gammaproteobacteria bacterium]|nr:hypothetical protein [Gammaproteobacteria bacterium]
MNQNPINNDPQNNNFKSALFEESKVKLGLIIFILCILFILVIQPNLMKYLLLSSPMLWECM